MATTHTQETIALATGEGETRWWTGELATIKLRAEETGGAFSLVEVLAPPGLAIPRHVHHLEDETFWILEGSARFTVADEATEAGPGALLFGPRDVPHSYVVGQDGCRMLFLFSPGGFEGFVIESSQPAEAPVPPPSFWLPEEQIVAELCERYGVELLL